MYKEVQVIQYNHYTTAIKAEMRVLRNVVVS